MPIYFFHIVGRVQLRDSDGTPLAEPAAATDEAAKVARELAADGDYSGCFVLFVDEGGSEIGRVEIGGASYGGTTAS